MRFSECHDLAVHGLCCLAAQPKGRLLAAKDMAKALGAKLSYLAKILQVLAHAGLVEAKRGKAGGYGLSRPASEITLSDILGAVNGGPRIYPCPGTRRCSTSKPCAIRAAFDGADRSMTRELGRVTLSRVVADLRAGGKTGNTPWLQATLVHAGA